MSKILYSESTSQLSPYPRNDDNPIIGLDSDYLVLTQVESPHPNYDIETQSIVDDWEVDLEALEYRQSWTVIDLPVIDNPPNWDGFYKQLKLSQAYQFLYINSMTRPGISGAMAAMGFAINDGDKDPSNPDIFEAFQSSVSGVLLAVNVVGLSLTVEMLAEVRQLLDDNGLDFILLE